MATAQRLRTLICAGSTLLAIADTSYAQAPYSYDEMFGVGGDASASTGSYAAESDQSPDYQETYGDDEATASDTRHRYDSYYEGFSSADADEAAPAAVDSTPPSAAPQVASQPPLCACGGSNCIDCKKVKALQKAAASAYKPLFYDNSFDYLNNPQYSGWHLGENAKQLQCGACWTFDFGGQYRLRYQSENNMRRRRLTGLNDDFLLHRTRLYTNVRYSDWFRFYAEAIDATSNGQRNQPLPIEVNRFDALNLFGDFKVWERYGNQMWIRPGRQELLYGAQRLVSPLDWSNTRRTFDGVKAYWRGARWDIDGWWTQPVLFGQHMQPGNRQDHNFDRSEEEQDFVGLWARYKTQKGRAFEGFFLRRDDYRGLATNPNGNQGDLDYNMFGGRLLGNWGGLLYEAWGGYQFGQWADDDITAGVVTFGLGKAFRGAWKPTVWAYYDWASGDHNLNDNKVATASQYFPLAHKYLGWMDIFGRKNIQDVNVMLTTNPTERLKFIIWYHAFFLQSRFDALYGAGGLPEYQDPTGSAGNQVGQELDLIVKWSITPRADAWFGYSHFFSDSYFDSPVIQGGPAGTALNGANGNDADFFYTQWTINF
jgi:hypothetical protein